MAYFKFQQIYKLRMHASQFCGKPKYNFLIFWILRMAMVILFSYKNRIIKQLFIIIKRKQLTSSQGFYIFHTLHNLSNSRSYFVYFYNNMIFEVFGPLFTFKVLLQKPCKTSPSYFNFGVAGLNLGRWAEKEQARRSFTRLLD